MSQLFGRHLVSDRVSDSCGCSVLSQDDVRLYWEVLTCKVRVVQGVGCDAAVRLLCLLRASDRRRYEMAEVTVRVLFVSLFFAHLHSSSWILSEMLEECKTKV